MASLEVVLEKTDKEYSDEEKLALAERKNNIYVESLANLDKSAVLDGVFEFIAFFKEKLIEPNMQKVLDTIHNFEYGDEEEIADEDNKTNNDDNILNEAD